jgi:uncharacterized protein YbjT (DUF2867 family)
MKTWFITGISRRLGPIWTEAALMAVDVRDIASAALTALVEKGHEGQIYNLTGPQALSHREMAEKPSQALGSRIDFVDVPPESKRKTLIKVGLPVWQADGLIEDYAHSSRGEAAEVATGVQDATGRPPRLFDDVAGDYAWGVFPASLTKEVGSECDGHTVPGG